MYRRVAETVARLDPGGEDILFVVGSDHGMETVAETIDLEGLLIDAGLKDGPGSSDVVIAPNGTAALIYFTDPESAGVADVARFLEIQDWVGRVFTRDGLAATGLPTSSRAQIAITMKADDRANPHGVPGHSHIVRNSSGQDIDRLWPAWRARRPTSRARFCLSRAADLPPALIAGLPRSSTLRQPCCAISAFPSTASTAARCLVARARSDPISSGTSQPLEFRS